MPTVMAHLRRNTVAYLALFVALGGSSYAALRLPANSVGTKQLKRSAVTLTKINPKTRRSLRGARGPKGDKGDRGAPGAPCPATDARCRGPQGATGVAGPGAKKIVYDGPSAPAAPTPIGSAGPFQLTAQCSTDAFTRATTLTIRAAGPAGRFDGSRIQTRDGATLTSTTLDFSQGPSADSIFAQASVPSGSQTAQDSTVTIVTVSATIFQHWHLSVDATAASPTCHASFVTIPVQ